MVSPYLVWKSGAQKVSSGWTSVEPAPVSEYALAPAVGTSNAVRHVISATMVTIGNLLAVKGPPRCMSRLFTNRSITFGRAANWEDGVNTALRFRESPKDGSGSALRS